MEDVTPKLGPHWEFTRRTKSEAGEERKWWSS